jgi:hypothetical protein
MEYKSPTHDKTNTSTVADTVWHSEGISIEQNPALITVENKKVLCVVK